MNNPAITSGYRRRLADTVAAIHSLLAFFFGFGWTLPWTWAWWGVLAGALVMPVVWLVCSNNCPLTLLEKRLRGESVVIGQDETSFIAETVSRLLGRKVSNRVGDHLAHGILYTSAAIAAWRLFA